MPEKQPLIKKYTDPETATLSMLAPVGQVKEAAALRNSLGLDVVLAASTDRNDAGAQGFEATVREKMTAIATPTIWPVCW